MTTDQLTKLNKLADKWANDPLNSEQCKDVSDSVMDLLPDVLAHIKQLTSERDAALKACAEMRNLLMESPQPWSAGQFREWLNRRKHAMSTDCGKGYHADEEWSPIVESLSALHHDCTASDFNEHWDSYKNADKALAHAERLMGKEKE